MRNLGRLLFVLAIIAGSTVTWLNLSWKELGQLTNSPSESRIDYYLSDFTLMRTDSTGQINYHLTGHKLTHKQASGTSEIYWPHIQLNSQNGQHLTIDSEKARQESKDGNITLNGSIRVHKEDSTESSGFTLTTQDLTYNPKKQLISTDAEIDLVSTVGTLHGTGFETSLDEQELRILSNVHAEFQAAQ